MATYNYKPGLGLAAAYQVSAKPWVKGGLDASSNVTLTFPNVTSWVVISNTHANLTCRVGFSAAGAAGNNYITIPANSMSPRLELKLTELYLDGDSTTVDVLAGLTYIQPEEINNPSVSPDGNNWAGSPGALVG